MCLNDDIADIKKTAGVCLPTFVVNYISGLFLHPSIFFSRNQELEKSQFLLSL